MKVRKDTIEKPKFIVTYLNSLFLLLAVFTVIALIPYMGSYMSYEYSAQEFKSYMNLDNTIGDYAYENNIEKDRLSGEDISRIKNALITNYLSYGQRYPPVSVYGTGTMQTIAAFLDGVDSCTSLLKVRYPSRFTIGRRICLPSLTFRLARGSIPGLHYPSVSPQFCYIAVQESQPVVHRLRLSPSP